MTHQPDEKIVRHGLESAKRYIGNCIALMQLSGDENYSDVGKALAALDRMTAPAYQCTDCGDTGHIEGYDYETGCCGNPYNDGQCCGNSVQVQVPVMHQCECQRQMTAPVAVTGEHDLNAALEEIEYTISDIFHNMSLPSTQSWNLGKWRDYAVEHLMPKIKALAAKETSVGDVNRFPEAIESCINYLRDLTVTKLCDMPTLPGDISYNEFRDQCSEFANTLERNLLNIRAGERG